MVELGFELTCGRFKKALRGRVVSPDLEPWLVPLLVLTSKNEVGLKTSAVLMFVCFGMCERVFSHTHGSKMQC